MFVIGPAVELSNFEQTDLGSAWQNYRMLFYLFVIMSGGAKVETLGGITLTDDDEALEFGRQLAGDLMTHLQRQGLVLTIFDDSRIVGRIPLAQRPAVG